MTIEFKIYESIKDLVRRDGLYDIVLNSIKYDRKITLHFTAKTKKNLNYWGSVTFIDGYDYVISMNYSLVLDT